jgi:hypothetical protein
MVGELCRYRRSSGVMGELDSLLVAGLEQAAVGRIRYCERHCGVYRWLANK